MTPKRLTKDGNPVIVIQNDNWFSTYGTQFFAVDQVTGTIYGIKDGGQWELTKCNDRELSCIEKSKTCLNFQYMRSVALPN